MKTQTDGTRINTDEYPQAERHQDPMTTEMQAEAGTYRKKGINYRIINISINPYDDVCDEPFE